MIAVLHPILATMLALVTVMPVGWCCAAGHARTAPDERATAGRDTGATCCRGNGAANSERHSSQEPIAPRAEQCCCSGEALRPAAEQVAPVLAGMLPAAQPEAVVLQPNVVAATAPMADLTPPPHRILHCVWRL